MLEHDPEKWKPVFRKASAKRFARRSCSNKRINLSEQAALDQALVLTMRDT
jgi:hypothetical protein